MQQAEPTQAIAGGLLIGLIIMSVLFCPLLFFIYLFIFCVVALKGSK
jgi:uncharacterized membrane protein